MRKHLFCCVQTSNRWSATLINDRMKIPARHLLPHLFLQNNNGKLDFTRKVRKRFTYIVCDVKYAFNVLVVAPNNLYGSSPLFSFAQCGEDEVVWEKLPKCANSKCWTHQGWKMVESGEMCTDGGCTDIIFSITDHM